MIINQSIIADIKAIIAQSKDKAIRAVDHQRTLMYWHIGKRIFVLKNGRIQSKLVIAFTRNCYGNRIV